MTMVVAIVPPFVLSMSKVIMPVCTLTPLMNIAITQPIGSPADVDNHNAEALTATR